MPKAKLITAMVLLAPLGVSCHRTAPIAALPACTLPAESLNSPFDAEITDIVAHADHLVSRRITREGRDDFEHDIFNSHRVLGPAIPVNAPLQREISGVLLSPENYDLGTTIQCFEPGVRYEFFNAKRSVAFEICFSCQMLRVIKQNDINHSLLVCFTPGFNRVLRITKKAFAADGEIQSIPAQSQPVPH